MGKRASIIMVTCTRKYYSYSDADDYPSPRPRKRRRGESFEGRCYQGVSTIPQSLEKAQHAVHQEWPTRHSPARKSAPLRKHTKSRLLVDRRDNKASFTSNETEPASRIDEPVHLRRERTSRCALPSPVSVSPEGGTAANIVHKEQSENHGSPQQSAIERIHSPKSERLHTNSEAAAGKSDMGEHGDRLMFANRQAMEPYSLEARDKRATLGPSITPPTAPITPPEHIPYVAYDPDFVPSLFSAYEWSLYSDHIRARKYGSEVAEAYRRGLTPEESRRRWEDQVKRSRAYVDASSDSEG